jgi:hypothetical protein
MKIIKYKLAIEENDAMFFSLNDFVLTPAEIDALMSDAYLMTKIDMFRTCDTSSMRLINFNNPSLQNILKLKSLNTTIYTKSIIDKHNMELTKIIDNIKNNIDGRRMYLNFSNVFSDYVLSTTEPTDVSCCVGMHFLKDRVSINFRANDMKNELFVDIITIYDSFIRHVYDNKKINIDVYSSTTQNIIDLEEVFCKIL